MLAREPADAGASAEPRLATRPPRVALVEGPDGVSAAEVPVEPPDPVVSAAAIGIEATAAPMPSATANAPTRPTYLDEDDSGAA